MKYNNYCGNENVHYIKSSNSWSDPLIEYKGFQWSAWEIEEALRASFEDSYGPGCREAEFVAFVNANIEWYLDDCLYGISDMDVDFIRLHAPEWFEELRDSLYYSDKWLSTRLPHDKEVINEFAGISFVVCDFIAA